MDDFLTFLLFFLFGYFVARAVAAFFEIKVSIEGLKEQRHQIIRTLANNVIMMRLETNEHGVFAYKMDSDEFLAHGATYDKMLENLMTRFPGRTAMVSSDQVAQARGE